MTGDLSRHLLVVLANATEGSDEEFNRWYDGVHLPQLLAIPGLVSARRYRLDQRQMRGTRSRPFEYLTLYEIESDDPKSVGDQIIERALDGRVVVSKALDVEGSLTLLYTELDGDGRD
jgi:hypothetical protein